MTQATTTRCPECGGDVRPVTGPGRFYRHHTMLLELAEDVAVPTCAKCNEEYIDARLGARIDQALATLYSDALKAKVQNAIEVLAPHARQYKLETLLGLSHGYLSKLKSGEKDPSAQLVALLALLANDPRRRLLELEDVWGGDPAAEEGGRKAR